MGEVCGWHSWLGAGLLSCLWRWSLSPLRNSRVLAPLPGQPNFLSILPTSLEGPYPAHMCTHSGSSARVTGEHYGGSESPVSRLLRGPWRAFLCGLRNPKLRPAALPLPLGTQGPPRSQTPCQISSLLCGWGASLWGEMKAAAGGAISRGPGLLPRGHLPVPQQNGGRWPALPPPIHFSRRLEGLCAPPQQGGQRQDKYLSRPVSPHPSAALSQRQVAPGPSLRPGAAWMAAPSCGPQPRIPHQHVYLPTWPLWPVLRQPFPVPSP